MAIKKGSTYTPDKKSMLLKEVKDEIVNIDKMLKNGIIITDTATKLQKVRIELVDLMQTLVEKKGVVTPQETDKILSSISLSKKTRMGYDIEHETKITPITIVMVALIMYVIYNLSKGKV